MNERPRVRFWIGLAAVAAIGLLATGRWLYNRSAVRSAPTTNHGDAADAPLGGQRAVATGGRVAAAPPKHDVVSMPASVADKQTTPEQEEARALTAKRYKAAQHSPNRLEWAPEEVRPSNMVLDLCDDVQATEAGLAFNALDQDRYSLGVVCPDSDHRFGYFIQPNEAMRFASSYSEAEELLKEFAETRTVKGEKFDKAVGMLMGHDGPWPVDSGLALDPCGTGFGCAAATIDVSRGATRGLFANVSDQVAHDVTISAGNVVAHHPLSVQPGESSAFVLPAELSAAELATLTITATFVGKADPRRAVRMMGAPGDITAPREELAKLYFGIAPSGPPVITIFAEALMLDNSTTHPSAAQSLPGQILDAPTSVVVLLDEHSKIVDVLQPPVTQNDGPTPQRATAMDFVKIYAIAFVTPPGVAQSFISVGGAE